MVDNIGGRYRFWGNTISLSTEMICFLLSPEQISESESCLLSEAFSVARTTIAAASLYRSRTALTMSFSVTWYKYVADKTINE